MTQSNAKRETFSGRKAFIMAAIGSAVGLGKHFGVSLTPLMKTGAVHFIIPYLMHF